MPVFVLIALWVVVLAVTLYSAEQLVGALATLGHRLGMSAGLLGLLVALGADAPEVTSALVALSQGSADIGLGVVVGSNIYNLAGLLGLAAVVARGIASDGFRLALDGGANIVLTLVLIAFLQVTSAHAAFGALLLLLFAGYVALLAVPRERLLSLRRVTAQTETREESTEAELFHDVSTSMMVIMIVLSLLGIVGGSDLLVNISVHLGPRLGIPTSIMGTFILPVATSLPNTWAAISLARRNLASAAVAATFNSNSINIALGTALPALFIALRASRAAQTIDAGWLIGMTVVAVVLLATRRELTAWEGGILLALYAAFVAFRLAFFS